MIKHILFDLDDTLYPTAAGLMQEISQRMNAYMIEILGVDPQEVTRIRQDFWERYGTTLRGLYIERNIDAQAFLNYVHDIQVTRYLKPDARLQTMLAQLDHAKYVFTNAPAGHARRVLSALGVERYFLGIFDINFIAYESKPALSAYQRVLAALGAPGDECVMIDDSVRNLVAAKAVGMQTVLLDGKGPTPVVMPIEGVDASITTIYELANVIHANVFPGNRIH